MDTTTHSPPIGARVATPPVARSIAPSPQAVATRLWALVRADDWWAYKIPPLLAVIYATAIRFPVAAQAWTVALGAVGAIVLVAIFGYLLNDIADIESDRRAGRRNSIDAIGQRRAIAALTAPLTGVFILGWWIGDPVVQGLLALNLLLPTLYSVPPVRWKVRGLLGVLADAGGAHVLPTAIVIRAVTAELSAPPALLTTFVAAAIGWALCAGLRSIIVHQVRDQLADRRSGITTFGGKLGMARGRRLVRGVLVPAELICLGLFLGLVVPAAPVAAGVLLVWLLVELRKLRRHWTLPLFDPTGRTREPYLPLASNDLYELWLPFGLCLQLALVYPMAWLLLAAQVLFFFDNTRTRLAVVGRALFPDRLPQGGH